MAASRRCTLRRVTLAVTTIAFVASCAEDESPPGEPTITLYDETIPQDPTPTTAP